MPKWILVCLGMGMAAVLAACGGGATDDTENPPNTELSLEPVIEQPAVPEIPEVEVEPVESPVAETAPEEQPVDVSAADSPLEGSKWKWRDFTITFKEGSKLHVMGGLAAQIAPQGVEGTYALDNGVIEIRVLTFSPKGTWDGTSLVIDGIAAQREV